MDNIAINKNMTTTTQDLQSKKQPDEKGGIHLQGHIKIFDPVTKKCLLITQCYPL